jgi:hypothetical protein
MKEANANTGSSTFAGGIDKVSSVRYYQVDSYVGTTMAAASVSADIFAPSYLDNDGVNRFEYGSSRGLFHRCKGNVERYGTNFRSYNFAPTTTPTTITPDALGSRRFVEHVCICRAWECHEWCEPASG